MTNPTSASMPLSHPRRWGLGFAIWTLLACLSFGQAALYFVNAHTAVHWASQFIVRLTDWYTLAIFTPLLFWLARRFPADQPPRWRNILVLLASALPIVVAKYSLLVLILRWMSLATPAMTLRSQLMRNLVIEMSCTWAALGVIHAILFYERLRTREIETARMATELAEARFEALTHQLQPHFVFNTLNSAVTLIRRDPSAAEDMLIGLGEMLHRALDEQPVVPLASEISLVEKYVEIMRRRFAQPLKLEVDVSPDAATTLVPRFLLQPLVENSLEHGIAHRAGAGAVHVHARRDRGEVSITVEDDGLGLPNGEAPAAGIGLRNTIRRLQALYGDRYALRLGRATLGGASVRITLPVG